MTFSSKNRVAGLFALITIAATINGVFAKPPIRIIGGTEAAPGTFRFIVSLSIPRFGHSCGGAIITPRHILTAAHCIFNLQPSQLVIRSGIHNLNARNATVSNVKSFLNHPRYVSWIQGVRELENDIGIIVLEKDLDLRGALSAIALPTEQPDNDKYHHIAGWGKVTAHSTTQVATLQLASGIILLNDRDCRMKYGNPGTPAKLCGYKHDATICSGDSGSPLVSGGRVVGIASASSCVPGIPHVYVNVYHYINWIHAMIAQTS